MFKCPLTLQDNPRSHPHTSRSSTRSAGRHSARSCASNTGPQSTRRRHLVHRSTAPSSATSLDQQKGGSLGPDSYSGRSRSQGSGPSRTSRPFAARSSAASRFRLAARLRDRASWLAQRTGRHSRSCRRRVSHHAPPTTAHTNRSSSKTTSMSAGMVAIGQRLGGGGAMWPTFQIYRLCGARSAAAMDGATGGERAAQSLVDAKFLSFASAQRKPTYHRYPRRHPVRIGVPIRDGVAIETASRRIANRPAAITQGPCATTHPFLPRWPTADTSLVKDASSAWWRERQGRCIVGYDRSSGPVRERNVGAGAARNEFQRSPRMPSIICLG